MPLERGFEVLALGEICIQGIGTVGTEVLGVGSG